MPAIRLSEVPEGIREAIQKLYLNIDNVTFRIRHRDQDTILNVRIREQIDIEAKEMLILIANGMESFEPFIFNDTNDPVASLRLRFIL